MYSRGDVCWVSGGVGWVWGVIGGWLGFGHVGVFANSRNQSTAEPGIPLYGLFLFPFPQYRFSPLFSDLLLHLSIFFTIFYSLTLLFPVFFRSLSLSLLCSPHFHALNKFKVSGRGQAKCQGQKTFVYETVAA